MTLMTVSANGDTDVDKEWERTEIAENTLATGTAGQIIENQNSSAMLAFPVLMTALVSTHCFGMPRLNCSSLMLQASERRMMYGL